MATVLDRFHPLVSEWFSQSFVKPTEAQLLGWPRIQEGKSLLLTAPTGSGKTLTAFLSAIDQFVKGEREFGETSVLYVSPLKALNNDIERNLASPLRELQNLFESAGERWTPINTAVRSGDTPQHERQRVLRRPPEVLITTPESLALLLTTQKGRSLLSTVRTVILDEIHAVLSDRRGSHLMLSLERLVEVAGEFQRVALSATVKPLDQVAAFVGGWSASETSRPIEVIEAAIEKTIDLTVRTMRREAATDGGDTSIWPELIEDFKQRIQANESTLIFAASRRQAERIASMLNEGEDEILAYAHHGSLSREIRSEVEERLKNGRLRAIVATSTLELGIDIGNLDEVILVQTPENVASAMQRIGRAGHQVGETSHATLYPLFERDYIDAAVIANGVQRAAIEPIHIVEQPLDLLAQTMVSMTATEEWHVDVMYDVVTRSWPFHSLPRQQFELVIDMLNGKYDNTRIRDLRPRIAYDPTTGVVSTRKGASMALYTNSGTIPDRGYYQLRHADSNALIGELDEEFVWETKAGKQFIFGSQQWVVTNITHNDVLVRAATARDSVPPFYRSEFINQSFHYATQVTEFLQHANELLATEREAQLITLLRERQFDELSAKALVTYLRAQREATGCDLPHAKHVVAELVDAGPGGYSSAGKVQQLVLHTGWGGTVNRPIALSLAGAWEEVFDTVPDIVVDNQTITIQMKQAVSVDDVRAMLDPDKVLERIRRSLEKSGFFGGRFRECAGRALLLSKSRFERRMPLWLIRMQAKDLMNSVAKYQDFPILLETWRTCLQDEFDMTNTRRVLEEIENGSIAWTTIESTEMSPFARNVTHDQLNRYVYGDDAPEGGGNVSSLSDELISYALKDASLRPEVSVAVVLELERKLQRLAPGYEPSDKHELSEFLLERVWISEDQWFPSAELPDAVSQIRRGSRCWYVHQRSESLIRTDTSTAVENALQFYGPRTRAEFLRLFPLDQVTLEQILNDLLSTGVLTDGVVVEGIEERCICDTRNLDALIRFQRLRNRPLVEVRSVKQLPAFMTSWQQFGEDRSEKALLRTLERLQGFEAPVGVWLDSLWLSRHNIPSRESWLELCSRYEIGWQGRGRQRIAVGTSADMTVSNKVSESQQSIVDLFTDPLGSYSYLTLQQSSELYAEEFADRFWDCVWHGLISSDSIESLAEMHDRHYETSESLSIPSVPQRRFRLRRSSQVVRGFWRRNLVTEKTADKLEKLEEAKNTARILLDRYGIVTREICNREGRRFRWVEVFKALRMMELSGEAVAGMFFTELSGPQFATPVAIQTFLGLTESKPAFWISAYDPASPCGLHVPWPNLPSRSGSTMLGFVNGELVAVSKSGGSSLEFFVEADDTRLGGACAGLCRAIAQDRSFTIRKVNGESVLTSPYFDVLAQHMLVRRQPTSVLVESVRLQTYGVA